MSRAEKEFEGLRGAMGVLGVSPHPLLTAVEVLVHRLEPAHIIMCVGHQVHVQHVRLHLGACLHRDPKHKHTYPVNNPKVKRQAAVGRWGGHKVSLDLEASDSGGARPSQGGHT